MHPHIDDGGRHVHGRSYVSHIASALLLFAALVLPLTASAQDAPDPNAAPDAYASWKEAQVSESGATNFSVQAAAPTLDGPSAGINASSHSGIVVDFPGTGSWNGIGKNDDGSATIPLGFNFDFYGSAYSTVYLNNNGNLSFGSAYWSYSPVGFPSTQYRMIAPFWGDVDTRCANCGQAYYKKESGPGWNRFTAHWESVGYYSNASDKVNTFQVVISEGNDPLLPAGANVCFGYGDMAWTTGAASGGSGGFGGAPATVGANKGDGSTYFLLGRFNQPGTAYDGPGGANDGVSYLDGQTRCFNTSSASNVAPIASGFPSGNLFEIEAGTTLNATVQFLSPEFDQSTNVVVSDGGLANFTSTVTAGNLASIGLTFAPTTAQVGDHSVTFAATDDGTPNLTTNVTLTLRVTPPPNLPPTADDQSVTTPEDTPANITLTGSDPDGDPLTFSVATPPSNGVLSGTAPNLTYTPDAEYNGADSFTFSVNDGTETASATVSLDVTPVNDAPVADDQAVTTDEDVAIVITLTGSDIDGDALTFLLATPPANGTVSLSGDEVTYTPNLNYNGSDSFEFEVRDPSNDADTATVSITIEPVNDAPVAIASTGAATLECQGPSGTTAIFEAYDSFDVDGDALTYTWTDGGANIVGTGDSIGVDLPVGTHVITLTVDDGNGASDTEEVTVTIEDTTPPVVTYGATSLVLWSPNHKYHTIALGDVVSVSDQCSGDLGMGWLTSISSDEPDETAGSSNGKNKGPRGGGDGGTADDIVIGSCTTVDLRAERLGGGNGRVYQVNFAALDAQSNEVTGSFDVQVPHDDTGAPAVKDDPMWSVDAPANCAIVPNQPTAKIADVAEDEGRTTELNEVVSTDKAAGAETALDASPETARELPTEFALEQNYPNPFNPTTSIHFALPEAAHALIRVYNVMGQEVAVLVDGTLSAGRHDVRFDATRFSNGVYLYTMEAGDFRAVRRMVLMK